MRSAKLLIDNLATNQPPAFPDPHQRLCSKNEAVSHPPKGCPNQTVFSWFPHPCHTLHHCGAQGGSRHAGTAHKIPSRKITSSSLAHVGRSGKMTSPSPIGRSTWVNHHRFTLSRSMFCSAILLHLWQPSASLYQQFFPTNLPHFSQTPTQ